MPTNLLFPLFARQASHLSQLWAKEYRASARILPAKPASQWYLDLYWILIHMLSIILPA